MTCAVMELDAMVMLLIAVNADVRLPLCRSGANAK